jgi:hypothetical protein
MAQQQRIRQLGIHVSARVEVDHAFELTCAATGRSAGVAQGNLREA